MGVLLRAPINSFRQRPEKAEKVEKEAGAEVHFDLSCRPLRAAQCVDFTRLWCFAASQRPLRWINAGRSGRTAVT
jgi:hypothetical protein